MHVAAARLGDSALKATGLLGFLGLFTYIAFHLDLALIIPILMIMYYIISEFVWPPTPLALAAAVALNMPLPVVRLLKTVRALDIDALVRDDGPELTPLLMACTAGNNDRVRGLLSVGAGPDVAPHNEPRPIVLTSYTGNAEAVQDLLRAGANPNFLPSDPKSPLELACGKGHVEVVGALLRAGASPTAVGGTGMTPIGIACSAEDIPGPVRAEIVDLLLQAGADPRVTEGPPPGESASAEAGAVGASRVASGGGEASGGTASRGSSGRRRAGRKGASPRESSRTGSVAVNTLNANGASRGRQRRAGGPRAIELAARCGAAEVIPVLVAAGEDPGRAPADVSLEELMAGAPVPPLFTAAGEGHVGAVQALLAAGADLEATAGGTKGLGAKVLGGLEGSWFGGAGGGEGGGEGGGGGPVGNGVTALCYAVHSGHVDVVRTLLAAGADTRVHGAKLLAVAREKRMKEMEELLLAAQAAWN